MNQRDTICAISTAPGVGGIAVVRVSGGDAIGISSQVWRGRSLTQAKSHTAHLGTVLDSDGQALDQCVATVYRGPGSFTGDDVVEFGVHGSAYVQQTLIEALIAKGCRLAEPGEFTRRAFASGKMDLAQAEAVADIIASQSRAAHRIAMNQMRGTYSERLKTLRDKMLQLISLLELELDFSEEDVEFASRSQLHKIAIEILDEVTRLASSFRAGRAIKEGIPVAIVGATNAGKSSLLNALLQDDRAIVSDIHGTTRDVIEDTLRIGDYIFRIKDTAGLRHTSDAIENMGIERSRKAAASAEIIIAVTDATNPQPVEIAHTDAVVINVVNKTDIVPDKAQADDSLRISAKTGEGIDQLTRQLAQIAAKAESSADSVMVTNARHHQALMAAKESIGRAIEAIEAGLSGDLIAQDLRLTVHHLSSILGDITSSDVLANIFARFCIGK